MIFIVFSFGNHFKTPLNEIIQIWDIIIPFSPNISDSSFRIIASVSTHQFQNQRLSLIRFGFCDIQNNQGLGKGYQPHKNLIQ